MLPEAIDLKALNDRVVLEIITEQESSPGGIVIPVQAREKSNRGLVLSVGEECCSGVSVGDTVLYAKYSGTDIKSGGRDIKIVPERDILALVTVELSEETPQDANA